MFFINPERYIQAFENSPSTIREVSASFDTAEVIYALGKKYRAEDKISIVARLTAYVLVGLLPITQFRERIQADAGLRLEDARAIAGGIRDRVFAQVVDELRVIHGLGAESGLAQTYRAPLGPREEGSAQNRGYGARPVPHGAPLRPASAQATAGKRGFAGQAPRTVDLRDKK